ncbi:MAG: hypothetical protein IJM08_01280, partial [Firmicutes bacterium]|nr:hypothetical protein [Bacillota bacterium]
MKKSFYRKTLLFAALLAAFVFAFTCTAFADDFSDQLQGGYYVITQPDQLFELGRHQGAKYRLGADLDMSGRPWTPVDFFGELDGAGYTISG